MGVNNAGIIPARAGFTPGFVCSCEQNHGSSPLARGLRGHEDQEGAHARIIPARAGFTGSRHGRHARPADHPRSRGVYGNWYEIAQHAAGSSPLARGLPRLRQAPRPHPRIIPARAGFTVSWFTTYVVPVDHPRSRGVYQVVSGPVTVADGSSPLARGLLGLAGELAPVVRIIPARAGFTTPPPPPPPRTPDHPRSRGVYRHAHYSSATRNGSSPLARGLRP